MLNIHNICQNYENCLDKSWNMYAFEKRNTGGSEMSTDHVSLTESGTATLQQSSYVLEPI